MKFTLSEYLKFRNKRYEYWQYAMSKPGADRMANLARRQGYSARVVKRVGSDRKDYYLVYRRKK